MDNYCFGKFKKAKYELYRSVNVIYFFTTTIHSEKDCIELMTYRLMDRMKHDKYPTTYKIIKVQDGVRTELKRMVTIEVAA